MEKAYGGFRRPAVTAYPGGRRFFDQGRYVNESREDEGESCDLGEKIELVTDVGRSDIYIMTAKVSSQNLGHNNIVMSVDKMDDIVGLPE